MKNERVNEPVHMRCDYMDKYTVIGTRNDPRIGSCPWFWMWFWGPFYLLYKGMFGHFLIWCITFWTVIAPIVYIIKARDLVYNNMLKKGMLR
jgi:hypothetical protein